MSNFVNDCRALQRRGMPDYEIRKACQGRLSELSNLTHLQSSAEFKKEVVKIEEFINSLEREYAE